MTVPRLWSALTGEVWTAATAVVIVVTWRLRARRTSKAPQRTMIRLRPELFGSDPGEIPSDARRAAHTKN